MVDIVTAEKRSAMMAGIRSKNTKPEVHVRKLLHAMGFRFRLHRKDLPGHPDIVLPKYRTAIFVNGCYWHGHENCRLFRLPKSRTEFWTKKISANRERDACNFNKLTAYGWRIIVIWECAIPPKVRKDLPDLEFVLISAIRGGASHTEIRSTARLE